jgi:hypothetical protein
VGVVVLIVNSSDPPDATALPSKRRKPEQAGRTTPLKQIPECCAVSTAGVSAIIAAVIIVLPVKEFMRPA